MTVEQLINKLKKFPKDSIVAISNDTDFYEGLYEATNVEGDGESNRVVEIVTDYEMLILEKGEFAEQ